MLPSILLGDSRVKELRHTDCDCCENAADVIAELATTKAAATLLLARWRDGAFEDTGDAMALDALEAGADISDIIENWLLGVAGESDVEA
jgi:hypothetical protein